MATNEQNRKEPAIRVRRQGSTPPKHPETSAPKSIRISRTPVRPVRIEFPADGAEVEGATVSLNGTATPRHTMVLEAPQIQPLTCKTEPDGSWSMPEVALPQGSHTLTVVDANHPHRTATVELVITGLRPIKAVSPLQGETVESHRIEVTGKASPGRLVCLRSGRTTLTERADGRGSFRFAEVELPRWGEQHLKLYYAEDPGQGAAELVVNWPGLDLPSLVDPVTRAHLRPGADVVRCSACYTYCYRSTWSRLDRCPRCTNSVAFWQRTDSKFHTPRARLVTNG